MKPLKCAIVASALLACCSLSAQDDAVLMTIDTTKITKGEFEYIYKKNNANNAIDKKSLTEYVDLFENFKLKVIEAEHRGMDTLPMFVNELRGYRNQLSKPYLTDLSKEEDLCKEAYDHLLQDVEVSHILIKLPENATPADTLEAYNKAVKARARLDKEDFGKVATEMSDDPSVEKNKGYLGFFTGGMLVYPFENAMYKLNIGEISQPVRTYYGYHIIKVHSRRPAVGQVHVAHIMKMVKADASDSDKQKAYEEIKAIAERLKNGEDFAAIAREESDDRGTAARGGELAWFGVGRMVREFETAAFALNEVGEVSEPVQSAFGWHLIKLLDKRSVDTYENKRADILRQMQHDERADMGRMALVEKLKTEYNYTEKTGALDNVQAFMQKHAVVDSLYFIDVESLTDTFATYADVTITQRDLAFVIGITTPDHTSPLAMFDEKLKDFLAEQILGYEDTQLERKYPEFRYLMQEYHDGILLFNISNDEVWEKAAKDTEGLEKYFKAHKADYAWSEPHYKGRLLYCKDVATAKQVKKIIAKLPADSVNSYLKSRVNNDSVIYVRTETGLWTKGSNAWVDRLAFKDKTAQVTEDESLPVVVIMGKMLKKGPESVSDVRGVATADYQNELERLWIEALRAKYEIKVDEEVLNSIE